MNRSLTTNDAQSLALDMLGEYQQQADGYLLRAHARRGDDSGTRYGNCISVLLDQCVEVLALARLCERCGDTDAAEAITAAWSFFSADLIARAAAARQGSLPQPGATA
jgi:hypothetical protein